jgi:hypothetical protein
MNTFGGGCRPSTNRGDFTISIRAFISSNFYGPPFLLIANTRKRSDVVSAHLYGPSGTKRQEKATPVLGEGGIGEKRGWGETQERTGLQACAEFWLLCGVWAGKKCSCT